MAMIRLCDWTKKQLDKDDLVFEITIEGEDGETLQYEVGDEGRTAILNQLNGADVPNNAKVQVVEKIILRDPPPEGLISATPGIDAQVTDNPFDPGPASMPSAPQGNGDDLSMPIGDDLSMPNMSDDGVPPIEIPADVKQRLRTPSREQQAKVVAESTKFAEGSLPALTRGGAEQIAAVKRLREIEADKDKELQRSTSDGVKVNINPKPTRNI